MIIEKLLVDSPEAYFLTEMSSKNNGRDAKGYFVATNVVAARTGVQEYYGREIGVTNKSMLNDIFYLERPSSEVFSKKTMASFNGAAFTDGHPSEGRVTSKNSKRLSKGIVTNPRKADFLDDNGNELLLVDIIVSDEDLIKDIEKGKRQVSAGYAWDYEVINMDERKLRVKDIRANHLALVDRGRAKSAMIMDKDIDDVKVLELIDSVKEINLNGGENMADEKMFPFSLKDSGEIVEVRGFETEEEAEQAVMEYYKEKSEEK